MSPRTSVRRRPGSTSAPARAPGSCCSRSAPRRRARAPGAARCAVAWSSPTTLGIVDVRIGGDDELDRLALRRLRYAAGVGAHHRAGVDVVAVVGRDREVDEAPCCASAAVASSSVMFARTGTIACGARYREHDGRALLELLAVAPGAGQDRAAGPRRWSPPSPRPRTRRPSGCRRRRTRRVSTTSGTATIGACSVSLAYATTPPVITSSSGAARITAQCRAFHVRAASTGGAARPGRPPASRGRRPLLAGAALRLRRLHRLDRLRRLGDLRVVGLRPPEPRRGFAGSGVRAGGVTIRPRPPAAARPATGSTDVAPTPVAARGAVAVAVGGHGDRAPR